jgi:hypothetical protein
MKRFSFFMFVATGILCSYTANAMEQEQPVIPTQSTEIDNKTTPHNTPEINLDQQLHKKHHHHDQHAKIDNSLENASKDKLHESLKNLEAQPKPEQDEIEKMLQSHKTAIADANKKHENLKEHVINLHTALVHLKKPHHYSLQLPSAIGTSIISLYTLSYAGKSALKILHHDEVKKNLCKLLLAGGILAWSGSQAWHYWRAFVTPTLGEKHDKKIHEIEGKILNDETAGANK